MTKFITTILISAAALSTAMPAQAESFLNQHLAKFEEVSQRFAARMQEKDVVKALDCTTITTSYFDVMSVKVQAATDKDMSHKLLPLFMGKATWTKVTDRLLTGSVMSFDQVKVQSKVIASQASGKSETEKQKFAQELLSECMGPISWQFAQDKNFQTYLNAVVPRSGQ